jgi:hypothetical protein
MTWSGVATSLLFFISAALVQNNAGTMTGTVTDPDGGFVAGAEVQAKHIPTGRIFKTESLRTGAFTLPPLPPGTYELSVPAIGFTFFPYLKKDLVVQAGQTLRTDVHLEWPVNLGTLGDDTFLTIKNRYAGISGAAPRTPDGKPDFSGVWNGSADLNEEEVVPLPWADAKQKERVANSFKDTPSGFCLPGELFPSSPLIYKIIQTSSLLVELGEDVLSFRQVYLDGRGHPKDPFPMWKGHSIGKWEGDTLVIDTVGFNDKNWLPEGYPSTEMLHVIERYRRPDLGHLNIDITIEDPGTLTKPWNLHTTWNLAPGEDVIEYVCTENNQYRSGTPGK